jgi:hypothetical protein
MMGAIVAGIPTGYVPRRLLPSTAVDGVLAKKVDG